MSLTLFLFVNIAEAIWGICGSIHMFALFILGLQNMQLVF